MAGKARIALLCTALSASTAAGSDFIRGDLDQDGLVSIRDMIAFECFFVCEVGWSCLDSADVDDDGRTDITDAVRLFEGLYTNDFDIPAPFPSAGTDPTLDENDCIRYASTSPPRYAGRLWLGEAVTRPGGIAAVPIHVSAQEWITGVELLVRYDPERFTPLALDDPAVRDFAFAGTALAELFAEECLRCGLAGVRADPAAGLLRVGIVPGFFTFQGISPGEDVHFGNLVGVVADDLPIGAVIELRLTTVESGPQGPIYNQLAADFGFSGGGIVDDLAHGSIRIAEVFVRGDTNGDGGPGHIIDAIYTLDYLFSGTREITCPDAADFNDDGAVNISDPIWTLQWAFSGGPGPPLPWPHCGADETADALGCPSFPGC